MNYADSERIATICENLELKKTNTLAKADLIIYNTCSVRQSAEDRILGLKKNIYKLKSKRREKYTKYKLPITILTGCMCKRSWRVSKDEKFKEKKYLANLRRKAPWIDLIIQISQIDKLTDLIKNKDRIYPKNYLNIKANYESNYKAFVPISTGCDEFCSYCIVPFSRGKQKDRPPEIIISEVKTLLKKGYKSITLLGQNVNSWKNPKKGDIKNYLDLLKAIDNIYGNFWLSFLSSHPKYVSEEFIEYFAKSCNKGNKNIEEDKEFTRGDHIRPYFNLALQSGSDNILQAMNRKYTYSHFLKIAKELKKKIPNLNLSTDIIVGFPGETIKDFHLTKKAFKKIKFDMAYINKYSPRKGTASYKLKNNITWQEKKRRAKELTDILRKSSFENNRKYISKKVRVLVDEINEKQSFAYAKSFNFKDTKIHLKDKNSVKIGELYDLKVTKASNWSLEGEMDNS